MTERAPGFVDRLARFTAALRRAGVTVSTAEDVDAVASTRHLDLLDRAQVREALAATMVKSHSGRRTFDDLFNLYFPARPHVGDTGDGGHDGTGEQNADTCDPERFLDELVAGLLDGDDAEVRRLAREAVDRFGRAEGRDGQTRWFQYRVFKALDMNDVLERLLSAPRPDQPDVTGFERRLLRDEFEARIRGFREEVEGEIRRRYAVTQGPERIADRVIREPLAERDFFRLSRDEQAEIRRQLTPLARRLATRLAVRRRRGRRGRLDVRRTVRNALGTGGVPFDPVFRPSHPTKPELFVLCDVSGSVAAFARFTLSLTHELQDQFTLVRSFAFVDTLDEVTRFFASGSGDDMSVTDAVDAMTAEADLVWFDGHSDYGHSLEVFASRYARDVTPRTSVLVLGDARNNYRRSGAEVLDDLSHRARHLYWLNPETISYWDTGDSIASSYARYVDDMVEVRNLTQLSRFIERLA